VEESMTPTFYQQEEILEEHRCVKCEVGLAIFGVLLGAVFLAISIDVLVKLLREGREE
jgi:hypothetical protein